MSSASALVCCRVIWQFTAGNRLVMSRIFRQSPGLVTKISSSAPLRQPRPSLVQINLSYYLSLHLQVADCQAHLLMVVMFDVLYPVFFLHCFVDFVDFLRLCLRFPALCRTLLHVSEPLRLKRLLKHPVAWKKVPLGRPRL